MTFTLRTKVDNLSVNVECSSHKTLLLKCSQIASTDLLKTLFSIGVENPSKFFNKILDILRRVLEHPFIKTLPYIDIVFNDSSESSSTSVAAEAKVNDVEDGIFKIVIYLDYLAQLKINDFLSLFIILQKLIIHELTHILQEFRTKSRKKIKIRRYRLLDAKNSLSKKVNEEILIDAQYSKVNLDNRTKINMINTINDFYDNFCDSIIFLEAMIYTEGLATFVEDFLTVGKNINNESRLLESYENAKIKIEEICGNYSRLIDELNAISANAPDKIDDTFSRRFFQHFINIDSNLEKLMKSSEVYSYKIGYHIFLQIYQNSILYNIPLGLNELIEIQSPNELILLYEKSCNNFVPIMSKSIFGRGIRLRKLTTRLNRERKKFLNILKT